MNGLTQSIARYGAKYGIRCNCVAPGPVMTREAMANMATLMGRAAEPQEIVDLILYLASDHAAFITGINILADGGRNLLSKIGYPKKEN
jgi:NAD(P)-dependent dehydrogenase (short-subunit alcohol dehydrogenase family)